MSFEPETEEEILRSMLLPEGKYDGCLLTKEFTHSKKSGNEMMVLDWDIWDEMGKKYTIKDFVLAEPKFMKLKLSRLCKSLNKADLYKTGSLKAIFDSLKPSEDWARMEVNIQAGQKKDDGTFYRDKNAIFTYIEKTEPFVKPNVATQAPIDEDIPF